MAPKDSVTQETLPERSVPASRAGPLELVLRFTGALAKPPSFRLDETCRIGSGPDCDVVVDHPMVSRAHVEVEPAPRGARVRDLGSRNGTSYLGQRLDQAVLAPGASFQIGPVTVTLSVDTEPAPSEAPFEGEVYRAVVGRSAAMKRLFGVLCRLEKWLVPVLIEGESGVGKEMVARAIHEGSTASAGPFVCLNCGALPRELIASELFGHRRGAFTGATETRRGTFESAHGGTLFLDEIGELPLEQQPVLLRVLETGEVRRVGDDVAHKVDVRIVAATNRDLDADTREGRFREDLLFRLAVVRLAIPPLRQRPDDIELLATMLAEEIGIALPRPVREELKTRPWPGNVRELKNALQAYAVLGALPKAAKVRPEALDVVLRDLVDPLSEYAAQKEAFVDRFTSAYLERLLDVARGNRSVAARIAKLDRGYLRRLLGKHGLGKGGRDDD